VPPPQGSFDLSQHTPPRSPVPTSARAPYLLFYSLASKQDADLTLSHMLPRASVRLDEWHHPIQSHSMSRIPCS
jgi:hypothetical protein